MKTFNFREVVNVNTNKRTYYVNGKKTNRERFEHVKLQCRRQDCFYTSGTKNYWRFFSVGYWLV